MGLTLAAFCMAANIYFEARNQPIVGQHAVAPVTYNRAERKPEKVCDVVFEPNQFTWTKERGWRKRDTGRLARSFAPKDRNAWMLAKGIAQSTVAGHVRDFTMGARFYHNRTVRPAWRKDMRLVAVIGHHKFYREA